MTDTAAVARHKASTVSTLARGAGRVLIAILRLAVKFLFFLVGFALVAARSYMRGCVSR